jgi:hypothetical protein
LQLEIDQLLETVTTRFQAEAMGTQQDRRAVEIVKGVGDAGAHAGTELS